MEKQKISAIILAAGQGKRMNSKVQKQYLQIHNKPILYYTLKAFEQSAVDEIVIVTGKDELEYCKEEIVEAFEFTKIVNIVVGGKERYHSVYNGLQAVTGDFVLIHDGARPFITNEVINEVITTVSDKGACIVAVPVKDTIKKVGKNKSVLATPPRHELWSVQTPQAFETKKINHCYQLLLQKEELINQSVQITDDAMVVELFSEDKIYVVEGDYTNTKITTPEDLEVAEIRLKKRK